MANTSERSYEDFEPVSDLLSEKEYDTLLLYLPGFRKDQLKVQLTTSRILRVSGERPMGDNKWRRFAKEFTVPSNIDLKEMTAKFEGGILYIRQPQVITPAETEQQDAGKTAAEAPAPQPQPEAPVPQPQPEAPAPQPQPEAPSEEKMEKKDEREEDATEKRDKSEISGEKNEGRKEASESKKTHEQAGGRSGLFQELRKPEKLIKLVVYVILLLILAFNSTRMFKSFTKVEQQSVLENDHPEL